MPANRSGPGGLGGKPAAPVAKAKPLTPFRPVAGSARGQVGVSGNANVAKAKLGLLQRAEKDVGHAVAGVLKAAYPAGAKNAKGGSALAVAQSPYIGGFGTLGRTANLEGQATGQALIHDPVATALHTVGAIPGAASATVMAPLHIIGTAVTGHPVAALKEIAGLPGEALAPYAGLTQPGGVAARAKQIEQQGDLPDLSLAAAAVGGGASLAGRGLSAAARGSRFGEAEFAATKLARERATVALQKAHTTVAANRDEPVELPPMGKRGADLGQTRVQRAKSLVHEASSTDRPPRRYGTDQTATPKVQPVGAPRATLVSRERSPNLFVSAAQTAVDRSRIAAQQGRLHRVVDAATRNHLSEHVPYASQLDTFTRPGEVVAKVRGGAITGRLGTTARGQVASVNAAQQDLIRETQEENRVATQRGQAIVKTMNPAQRDVSTFVKEGTIPAHDPVAGMAWLGELERQIKQGRRGTGGRKDFVVADLGGRNLSDNLRLIARVKAYVAKHGAGSVFNTDFERKVQALPTEAETAHRDPVLTPDTVMSKRIREQTDFLAQWAKDHPDHPEAPATAAAADQVRAQIEAGHVARVAGDDKVADDKFSNAYNLQRQMALNHGLPTDLAYMPHVTTLGSSAKYFRADARAPADHRLNTGALKRVGHTVRDPELLFRARARNVANANMVRLVDHIDHSAVGKDGMTAKQAEEFMRAQHLDPEHFGIFSTGTFKRDLTGREQLANDSNVNLDTDPEAQHGALSAAFDHASHTPNSPADSTATGFKVYPRAMLREMQLGMTPAKLRAMSRVKGQTSKLMLGLSPAWSLSMWPAYYMQGAAGGALSPLSWMEGARWRNSLSPAEERTVRIVTGIDSPVTSSHGTTGVHGSNLAPPAQITDAIHVLKSSPVGRLFAGKSPIEANMRFERLARVGSRTAVVYKDVKKEAVRQMIADSQGLMRSQDKVAQLTKRMSLLGRVPPERYMRAAMENQPAMEQMVAHVHNVLGEFHHMSRMERSTFNQVGMFYPWMRYSLKLAFHVLPAKHPLLTALGTYLGTLGEQDLTDLLGTTPALGTVYLGPQQPNTDPADRKFSEVGLHSVNPLMNSVMELIDASNPSKAIGSLPPYATTALDWLFGVDSFTGQPLKDKTGEAETSPPNPLKFAIGQTASALAPVRAVNAAVTGNAPQAADSVPFLGMADPMQNTKSLAKPTTSPGRAALQALLPFLPKPATELPAEIAYGQKASGVAGALPSRAQLLGGSSGGLPSRAKLLGGSSSGLPSRAKLLGGR